MRQWGSKDHIGHGEDHKQELKGEEVYFCEHGDNDSAGTMIKRGLTSNMDQTGYRTAAERALGKERQRETTKGESKSVKHKGGKPGRR